VPLELGGDPNDPRNLWALSLALYAYGRAFRDADPTGARDAVRRGLVIARGSRNRFTESLLAGTVSRLEAEHGDPLAALDYITLAIRNYHDAGNTTGMCTGRDDDHRRDGDLRLRPNRPGPNRTRTT